MKSIKFRGKSVNLLKLKRLVGSNGFGLKTSDLLLVMTTPELEKLHRLLDQKFGNSYLKKHGKLDREKVVKIDYIGTDGKKVSKPEKVSLFGFIGEQIEV